MSAPEASSDLHPQDLTAQATSPPNTAKPAKEVSADSGRRPTRSPTASACEPYRELIEIGLARGPQRHGDLAGPGLAGGFHQRLSERQALRPPTRGSAGTGSPSGDRDRTGRRGPSRLRHRSHGARSPEWQVSPHAA